MASRFLRRRGETPSPSDAAELLAGRWQGFRVARAHGLARIVIVIFCLLNIFFWLPQWKNRWDSYVHPRLVVSLSTIPSRIHLVEPTLKSLIEKQNIRPNSVYLTLPQKRKPNTLLNYTIPPFITRYQRQGKLRILSPKWDYGSISKVFYTLSEEAPDTRIVYLDDDVLYDPTLLQTLLSKSREYPGCAIALSGATLRNHFRQIGHTQLKKNRHPFLFFQTSGTPSFFGEAPIDIAQGFMGVLVQPSFFNLTALQILLEQPDLPRGVVRSDDFILSSHLEFQNVTRLLVEGGTPPHINAQAAQVDKLSLHMYQNAMEAAWYLQQYLGIWNQYQFVNPFNLSEQEHDAIICEAGRGHCFDGWEKVLRHMDQKYPPAKG